MNFILIRAKWACSICRQRSSNIFVKRTGRYSRERCPQNCENSLNIFGVSYLQISFSNAYHTYRTPPPPAGQEPSSAHVRPRGVRLRGVRLDRDGLWLLLLKPNMSRRKRKTEWCIGIRSLHQQERPEKRKSGLLENSKKN